MSRTYGRAYPISWRDVRGYDYARNGRGVTTIASVNGRGAYASRFFPSARVRTAGMSPAARSAHAQSVVRGAMYRRNQPHIHHTPHGSYVTGGPQVAKRKASAKSKRALRREHAFRKYQKAGLPKEKAAARAMREVPYEKGARGRQYKGLPVYTGKTSKRKKAKKKRPLPRQYSIVKSRRRVKKRVSVPVKRKVRVAYRRYKRARLQDPRTGKRRLSYMYRTKTGRFKKIPSWAIAGAKSAKAYRGPEFEKARTRTAKRRASAARRMERSGGAFVPNRSKKKMKRSKRRSRSRGRRSYEENRRKRRKGGKRRMKANRRKASRKASPWRYAKVGHGRGRRGVRLARGKVYYKGRKPRVLRGRRKNVRRLPKARIYLTNRRKRRSRKGRYKANRRYEENRRKSRRRKSRKGGKRRMKANRRRRSRRYEENRRRKSRRSSSRRRSRSYSENRRRSSRRRYAANKHSRRRSRRRYRRNFGGMIAKLAVAGIFATTGFVAQKLLTRLLVDKVVVPALAPKAAAGYGATDFKAQLTKWSPILVGAAVTGIGIFATSKVMKNPERVTQVGAGMVVAFIHTGILALLGMSESTGAKTAAQWIAGYDTSSTAAAIGRYRKRARRYYRGHAGLGDAPPMSIMPRYVPTGLPGGMQQAVAGQLRGGGMGEYFQTSGLGEYFASGVQGIGAYEMAGPLVTQAAAGLGQRIDDGIRPDANLDAVLTLAEAQAGLGGAVGEYYSAHPGDGTYTVPQEDQWIPNGELWAGTKGAQDPAETADIPAGILETAGGNGIFG
jgi:hypothetical protein